MIHVATYILSFVFVTTGASTDLISATNIARAMVTQFAMTDAVSILQ